MPTHLVRPDLPAETGGLSACAARQLRSEKSWTCVVGEKGSLWSFNFFLYNRKLKRMLYFCCRAISKTKAADSKESSSAYHSLSHTDAHVNDEDELDSRYGMAKVMDDI